MDEFRKESRQLTAKLSINERKAQGIYFTPRPLRKYIWETLLIEDFSPSNILEPSFGSGEFILDACDYYPRANIEGIEKNPVIYKQFPPPSNCKCMNIDFMELPESNTYDLIIGNPPFFVMKPKTPVEKQIFKESSSGRCNIYNLFLFKCLKYHLKPDGYLAFVLPTSIYNSSYYKKTRDYIYNNCTVISVKFMKGNFIDTSQDTCILIIKNTPVSEHNNIIQIGQNTILTEHYETIRRILSRPHTTLKEQKILTKTGSIIWNNIKECLTDEIDDSHFPLVYDHNIQKDTIDLEITPKNPLKKRYVDFNKVPSQPIRVPSIMIKRGYGNVFRFCFGYAPENVYAENHVIVILGTSEQLAMVYKSFQDPDTLEFMKLIIGNGSVTNTELQTLLPIFTYGP